MVEVSSDEVDDWEELMPDQNGDRLSPVYDAFDLALYADPEEFSLWEGFMSAYFLMIVPLIVGMALMITARIASGDLTVDEIVAAFETARATSSSSSELFGAVDYTEIGQRLLFNGLLLPVCLGVSLLVKTALKALARFRA